MRPTPTDLTSRYHGAESYQMLQKKAGQKVLSPTPAPSRFSRMLSLFSFFNLLTLLILRTHTYHLHTLSLSPVLSMLELVCSSLVILVPLPCAATCSCSWGMLDVVTKGLSSVSLQTPGVKRDLQEEQRASEKKFVDCSAELHQELTPHRFIFPNAISK